MNTFLQGCCFIPPEDDSVSTPSFSNFSPHSMLSARPSSGTSYELRSLASKEIFYIKRFPKEAWPDYEEERTCSNCSLQVLDRSSKSSSNSESRQRKKERDQVLFMLPEENSTPRVSYWSCSSNGNSSMETYYYVPTRKIKSPRRLITSTNKLLDFISACFWKCSPGCQQIPTIA